MAKRKDSEEPQEPPKRRGRDAAETVAQVARALRNRDEIVADALDLLQQLGVLDERSRAHVQGIYDRGDARTQAVIQELIARVLRVPASKLDDALSDAEEWDVEELSDQAIEALASLSLPEVDVQGAANRIRDLDVDAWLAQAEQKSTLLQTIGDFPVFLHRLRRKLIVTGVALFVVVIVALVFPDQALWIAFFGLLGLLALAGAMLINWGLKIDRLAKRYDVDLAVMAKLKPEERRLLLLRRIVLQVFDADKIGDVVEKGLGAVVPEAFQADNQAGGTPTRPDRPVAVKRRAAEPDSGAAKKQAARPKTSGTAKKAAAKKRAPAKRTKPSKTSGKGADESR